MALFVGSVLEKLSRDTFGVNPVRHEVVPLVPQHADDFGRQRFVQNFIYGFAVRGVALGDRALLDMLAGAFAQSFDVGQKWFISHGSDSFIFSCTKGKQDITNWRKA